MVHMTVEDCGFEDYTPIRECAEADEARWIKK